MTRVRTCVPVNSKEMLRFMVKKGYDRKKLARISHTTSMTISRILQGYPVRPSTIKRIADALERDPDDLIQL